jgi:Subunit ChlI of Mg-chelatase
MMTHAAKEFTQETRKHEKKIFDQKAPGLLDRDTRGRRCSFGSHSAAVFGIKAYPIAVEVDLSSGQKLNLMTVGLPDTAVRESSERVKAALRNCGYILPPQRITINLAPADVKKEGGASVIKCGWDQLKAV